MLNLTPSMELALAKRVKGGGTVYRYPAVLYEFYQPDHYPAEGAMFDPANAVELFSEVSVVWLGRDYRKLVTSRGSIGKHITGEFNGCTVTFNNVGPNNSKPMSEFVLSSNISGLRLVIRYIDLQKSATLADSIIVYVGRVRDPDTVSDEECVIPSKEELGSILHEIPKREFRPDDPLGREASDPLFEGIRSNSRTGLSYYTEKVTKRFLGFLWHVTKDQQRSNQFSAENDGHLGDVMPWINGRCQMEGIPVSWVDEGGTIRGLYIFSGSRVDSIENIQCMTEGFRLQSPPDGPPTTIIALGDPGGTGTNAAVDVNFAELGFLSNTAYVVAHFLGSKVENIDPAPTLTALVFGYGDLPDSLGAFTIKGRTDNPAFITRRVFTDQQALGMNPGLIADASFVRTAYLCDQYIKDQTNSELLAAGPDLVTAIENGDVTRFRTTADIYSRYWKFQMDPLDGDDPRGIPLDDPFPIDPGQPPVTPDSQLRFRRRFTFNAPLTDKMKAVDFLHNMVFAASRLFTKTDQGGRINLDMERPASSAHLALDAVPGQNYIIVSDIEPWRVSLKGEILIGAGLVTSEVRKVTGVEYDPSLGNAVTISVAGAGSTTVALESGGPTLIGGTIALASSATLVVGGIGSAGYTVTVTIDGHTVGWKMDGLDDPQTVAASLAMVINADQELRHYVLALWDGDVRVQVTSKLGKISLDAVLTNPHDYQIDSPTIPPTAVTLTGGGLPPGTWDLAYAWQSALGESMVSPRIQVTTDASHALIQTGAIVMPTGAASINWYISVGPGNDSLRFVGNALSGSPFTIPFPPVASSRREPTFNDTGEESIRVLFNWGPENIRQGTKVTWPLAARDDAVNQVYIEYISALEDFKTSQLTVNDYIHQARTGMVNRFEVNGRGIDSYDQAVRIANAVLAFKRDGNFSINWTTDEAGLPYEEGDVGCISDDSGLINQPVRIEHIEIQADNDVVFEGRIYATSMMQDLTGQKEIAISSPLKYVGAAPPPVSNVVLQELPPVASGNIWVSRVHGTFDFAAYRGVQLAHIYVKVFGDLDYHVVDVINPSLENTGVFDITGLPRTTPGNPHWLKIVAESSYGKTDGLEAAVAYPIDLLPPAVSILKVFDNVAPRESFQDLLGLTIGVARLGTAPEIWYGADLWRDRGHGPENIATLRKGSTTGHTTNGGISWLGDIGGYATLWIVRESGLFESHTPTEVDAGQNNYFVGREKIGVETWTETPAGSGIFAGTGLHRGLDHTEIFTGTHIAQEDVLLLDDSIYFLQCIEPRDVDHAVELTAVSIMQNFSQGTVHLIDIVRGDSYRPYAVTDYGADRDSSLDWFISFLGWPTPGQLPATWYVEIFTDATYTVRKRQIPVIVGVGMAAGLIGTTDGEFGVIKNNLYVGTTKAEQAVTIQALMNTWTRFDFNMRWIGPDYSLFMPISFKEFIWDAFEGAFNRPPTPAEESTWTGLLTTAYGSGPPGNETAMLNQCKALLSTNLILTPEYPVGTPDDTFINDCYQVYLGRNSEPAGHKFWLDDYHSHGSDKAHTCEAFGQSIEFLTERVRVLEPAADPSRRITVALQHKDTATPGPVDVLTCPISIQWEAAVVKGTVAERVMNYDVPIFEEAAFSDVRNQVDPGFSISRSARNVSGRIGPRYTIFLSGTEYRVYAGFVSGSGQKPLARCSAPTEGFPFPLRLVCDVKDTTTGLLCVENVTMAGDLQTGTIYPADQQRLDFTVEQNPIYVKIYQRGKYFNLQGFPIYFTAMV